LQPGEEEVRSRKSREKQEGEKEGEGDRWVQVFLWCIPRFC
jgi:hypothetical protein